MFTVAGKAFLVVYARGSAVGRFGFVVGFVGDGAFGAFVVRIGTVVAFVSVFVVPHMDASAVARMTSATVF